MSDWLRGLIVGWILLAAATLRLTGLAWDEFLQYHPDERFIAWVGTTIEWPEQWNAAAFAPQHSSFNPYYWPAETTTNGVVVPQAEPRRFAYGHFPLYLGVAATRLAEWLAPHLAPLLPADWLFTQAVLNQNGQIEFDHITAVGRVITALFDVGTVWLIYRLGQRLYGESVGLLAATFLTINVMHIQLAHFYTVDPFLTFFCTACLYFLLLSPLVKRSPGLPTPTETRSTRLSPFYLGLAAVMAGLAVGAKFAAILLIVPIGLRCWLDRTRPRSQRFLLLLIAGLVGFLAFFLTNPFAILDQTCEAITPAIQMGPVNVPALNWGSCFLENVVRQGVMANGQSDLGFTRQYAGTTPYLYFLEMQLKWGMGPLLGAAALLGLLYFIYHSFKNLPLFQKHKTEWSSLAQSELVLLAWVVPFLLSTGNFFVKFMRYLQPVTPILMLFAAVLMWQVRPRGLRNGVMITVLLSTTFYALAFSNIYQERHPWAAASAWIYDNIEPGATLTSEQWDDPLPTDLTAGDTPQLANQYQTQAELTWLTYADNQDTQVRLQQNLDLVAKADYLIISSHRVYGVVPRQPERFPLSSQFHHLLFSGQLGYEPVYVGTRMPNLAGFYFKWDTFAGSGLTPPAVVNAHREALPGLNLGRADESFTVYDQPLPIILANVQHLSPDELLARFNLP